MKNRLLAGVTLVGVVAVVFGVSAAATRDHAAVVGAKPHVQHIAFTIGQLGPTSSASEARPSNFTIAAGVPVKVTVTNFTREAHTFALPGLRINEVILPRRGSAPRITRFTFTAHSTGAFMWYCLACVGSHHTHAMSGTVHVR